MMHPLNFQTRRNVLKSMAGVGAAAIAGGLGAPALAATRELTIIGNDGNPTAREVFKKITDDFAAATGVNVSLNYMDIEGHKTAIRNYLVASPPDVCFWYSGERMRYFVERGLFEDLTDLYEKNGYGKVVGNQIRAVTVQGKQYGLPLGGRLLANFYLEDVFAKHGLKVPKDWDELLAYVESAKSAGLAPIAVGSKELWPVAGIFDSLNLRTNGLDFHMSLMDGKVSYLDKAVVSVFDRWEELVRKGAYLKDSTSYTYSEAAAFLSRGEAGFMTIGSFVDREIPDEQRKNLNYFLFPKIADIPTFDDFFVDSMHMPAKAKNKEVAREFLTYFYQPQVFALYSNARNFIPARSDLPPSQNEMLNRQLKTIAGVAGTAQYFDRDTNPDLAQVAMKGFQEFLTYPDRKQAILERIEQTRQRVFK
ncbi:ABC transporter substrate-binding protein [Rhizobium binae]|uniref:ABC transporter substrate-binding protein n=1 Tax=Rhizobium binae TaxID=1138190 RepID=UPI003DA819DF